MNMPVLNLNYCNLTPDELKIAVNILSRPKDNCGKLRASKPPVDYSKLKTVNNRKIAYYATEEEKILGEAYVIWRMVCFELCNFAPHYCIPCSLDFYTTGSYDERQKRVKELCAIADKIIATIPVEQRYGLLRWGKALGW